MSNNDKWRTHKPVRSKSIPDFDHERVVAKLRVLENGCWWWTGAGSGHGYGSMYIEGKNYLAHRLAWSIFRDKPTQGLVLDHLCKNTMCVNPEHLREVSQYTNTMENSNSPTIALFEKTVCKRGHEFTEENTYRYKSGNRSCRVCIKMHNKNRFIKT